MGFLPDGLGDVRKRNLVLGTGGGGGVGFLLSVVRREWDVGQRDKEVKIYKASVEDGGATGTVHYKMTKQLKV